MSLGRSMHFGESFHRNNLNTQKFSTNLETNLSFSFSSFLIDEKRVGQRFHSIPEVFAHSDLDFGRANKVKHQIMHFHDKTGQGLSILMIGRLCLP